MTDTILAETVHFPGHNVDDIEGYAARVMDEAPRGGVVRAFLTGARSGGLAETLRPLAERRRSVSRRLLVRAGGQRVHAGSAVQEPQHAS